jgi:PQQ-like domain
MTVFVAGEVKTQWETVAYRAATGARLWATKAYQPGRYSYPVAITVSPDGARVYVTGRVISASAMATVAYDADTGRQLWASRSNATAAAASALAVSPDGATVYVTGSGRVSGRQDQFAVTAYAAATGQQRWLHYYTKVKPGYARSVAISPDGKTVYATGSVGSYALTVGYHASGTVKWATRYTNPYGGGAAGNQIVTGPGGSAVYVAGAATNKSGHGDIATFAYRAATGKRMWLDRYNARIGGGVPGSAVTPDGRTVIVVGQRNGGHAGGYALASYNASTGGTRWMTIAVRSYGLVIDPHGNTLYVGGPPTAAYSVADGTLLWTATHGSGIIGLSRDGTRLFGWGSGGTIVAYQT